MVKTYLIDKEYLEKFLNMISMESVHNILVTPSEKYNVICSHQPEHAGIYMYAYGVMKSDIVPCDKHIYESTEMNLGMSMKRKYVRVYDTKYSLSQELQELLIECLKVLMPEVSCSFLSSTKFTLTTDV